MQPSEEQIKELMTTVACAACGSHYQAGGIEVLGHRDEFWFLRVSCDACASRGLVAAMIKTAESAAAETIMPSPAPTGAELDRARAPGAVTRGDVRSMRAFLDDFDGDFQALFAAASGGK